MSRPPHPPPRRRQLSPQISQRDLNSLIDEKPSWIHDLLSNTGTIVPIVENRDVQSNEKVEDSPDAARWDELEHWIEERCVYGPNSPRQKNRLTSSDSSMVNAVLESVPSNPLEYLTLDALNETGSSGCAMQDKSIRRGFGQRARARKLQYIADLERTVDTLQNNGADLAERVAALFNLHEALSIENNQLRGQIASLQRGKLMKDGEMQALKREVKMLKQIYEHYRRNRSATSCFQANPSGNNWRMLDMAKLNLANSLAPQRNRFGL